VVRREVVRREVVRVVVVKGGDWHVQSEQELPVPLFDHLYWLEPHQTDRHPRIPRSNQ
jgi:hypothetical protein